MKYLFAAIDARSHRPGTTTVATTTRGDRSQGPYHGTKPKFNPDKLKKLLVDASEGVDEKTSSHDFVDTLERIVNEIKNTTEHSGAFLQKVKKTDVPDYYDVIKKPMDLATLLKRVKSQMYRNKKSFADDLDLIWSNCLLYNSHPSHPLRRSAEFLRAKSNQLLEFITDPSLPTRSLYVAAVQRGGTGTPGPGGEDGDGEEDGEAGSEEEEGDGGGIGPKERLGLLGLNRKLNSGFGIGEERGTASPMGSRANTPFADRGTSHRRGGARGHLGRTRSPSPTPLPELGFEEFSALLRTPQAMADFAALDWELQKLEKGARSPVKVGEVIGSASLGILEAPVMAAGTSSIAPLATLGDSASATPSTSGGTPQTPSAAAPIPATASPLSLPLPSIPHVTSSLKINSLFKSLAPSSSFAPTPPIPPELGPTSEKPPDAIWWIANSGKGAMSAGMPGVGFINGKTSGLGASKVKRRKKIKMAEKGEKELKVKATDEAGVETGKTKLKAIVKAKLNGKASLPVPRVVELAKTNGKSGVLGKKTRRLLETATTSNGKVKTSNAKDSKKGKKPDLAQRMRTNVETLREVKRLHHQLGNGAKSAEGVDPSLAPLSDIDSDSEFEASAKPSTSRIKALSFLDTGVPPTAFRSPEYAPQAARDSMSVVSERVLSHAGFDGAVSTAVGVLAHVAAEYIMNLGRTIRFYADHYGSDMSSEQILLHVLGENGVPSPSHIETYVTEDIDRYGAKLSDLHTKLKRARTQQLDEVQPPTDAAEDQLLSDDVFAFGEINRKLGEDFFGLAEMGLEREAGMAASLPMRLLRGDPKGPGSLSSLVRFPPPPPHIPLTPSSIDCQIGLLRPFFLLRQKTEAGLVDDALQPVRPRSGRSKIPATGRIPVKVAARKRKIEDATATSLPVQSTKTKKKKVAERLESDS